MRNRTTIVAWAWVGMALSAGTQLSCTPEREYNQSPAGDAGGHVEADPDAGDASVLPSGPDAQANTGSESDSIGEISVILGSDDTAIVDAAVSESPDAAATNGESSDEDATTNSTDDAGRSSDANTSSTDVTSSMTSGNTGSSGPVNTDAGVTTPIETDSGVSCEPVAQVEADCSNGEDEDCDGLLDCDDVDDCAMNPACESACVPVAETELSCEDEADDDCDGFADCDDPDCVLDAACLVTCLPTTENCADGEDNDCDGFEDCDDSDCAAGNACCEAEGVEVCDDGVDNDCDGAIDCPIIVDAVPFRPALGRESWEGGAVSADGATLTLDTPVLEDYVVQCRTGKPAAVGTELFTVCDSDSPSSLEVKPFAEGEGSNAEHDGLTTTEVRFAYANGQFSQTASYTYYVHSSLYRAEACPEKADDADYFAAAESYLLSDDGATFDDADARLAAPFVNIAFTPRAEDTFQVEEGDGAVEYLSLRRRFVLNTLKNMILMKRVYKSRTNENGDCRAATIRKHATNMAERNYFRTACDAIVINREGAGVCLVVDESTDITIANPNSSVWQSWNFDVFAWVNWAQADNFMWRKLLSDERGTVQVFSRKCYDGASTCTGGNSNVLYLPDRESFQL